MTPAHVSSLRTLRASLRLSVLIFIADPQWLIPSSIAPVIFALAAFELFRSAGPALVLYAILGAGMMSMWGQTLYGSGWAIGQDREWGTLEPTLGAPAPYLYVVAGRVLWNAITGLFGGAIVFGVVRLAYGGPIPLQNPLLFAFLFAFVILTLAGVGLVFTSIFVYTRYAGFVMNIGEFAFYVLTGCMFAIVLLPFWTNPISLLFPPTWAVDALRYVGLQGYQGLRWGLVGDIAGALGLTGVYIGAAVLVFRRVERHVLEAGTADEY
ncbi:MAG: ABC transporter permease [Thermoplasmata archaeon]|nr:ABC transporter permease [Thermoplasmata archaeon]